MCAAFPRHAWECLNVKTNPKRLLRRFTDTKHVSEKHDEQDELGPEVMADHILFLLEHGLPSSLLTGKGHFPSQGPMAEN